MPPEETPNYLHQGQASRGFANRSILSNPNFFMYASLCTVDKMEEIHILRDGKTRSSTGSIVSSLYRLRDLDNREAGFFVFPDLSVRMEGDYRLRFSLFELVSTRVVFCQTIVSEPFHVYPAKKFPGMEESTILSRCLADQGLKIRIRKELRIKKSGFKDDDSISRDNETASRTSGASPSNSRVHSSSHQTSSSVQNFSSSPLTHKKSYAASSNIASNNSSIQGNNYGAVSSGGSNSHGHATPQSMSIPSNTSSSARTVSYVGFPNPVQLSGGALFQGLPQAQQQSSQQQHALPNINMMMNGNDYGHQRYQQQQQHPQQQLAYVTSPVFYHAAPVQQSDGQYPHTAQNIGYHVQYNPAYAHIAYHNNNPSASNVQAQPTQMFVQYGHGTQPQPVQLHYLAQVDPSSNASSAGVPIYFGHNQGAPHLQQQHQFVQPAQSTQFYIQGGQQHNPPIHFQHYQQPQNYQLQQIQQYSSESPPQVGTAANPPQTSLSQHEMPATTTTTESQQQLINSNNDSVNSRPPPNQ